MKKISYNTFKGFCFKYVYSRVPNKRTLLLFFFQKFSLPIPLIRVYTFIKCKKKGPNYTFIPAYAIILFSLYNIILLQLNRNYSIIQQPRGRNPVEVESNELWLKMFGPYAFVALKHSNLYQFLIS